MADLPRLSSSDRPPAPKFLVDAVSTAVSERGSSSSNLKPKTCTSQPTSPKMAQKQTSSQPTSPKSRSKVNIVSTGQSGSATGNPRNKCALQPGHSLMDWIRLGNSGRDLTGVGGRLRAVSPKELAAHNTAGDAWLAVRGRVYNVTHYLAYHPGGPDELMRGVGIDATQIFDTVHPWVNYESLLAKCLVGPLRAEQADSSELFGEKASPQKSSDRLQPSKAQELVRKSMENLANCITPARKRIGKSSEEPAKCDSHTPNPSKVMQSLLHSSELPVGISRRAGRVSPARQPDAGADASVKPETPTPPPPRFDWIQTSSKLTVSVYTRALRNPGACAGLAAGELVVHVSGADSGAVLTLRPERGLTHPLRLRVFPESGKVEVTAQKESHCIWRGPGEAKWEARAGRESVRRRCRLRRLTRLTHDSALLELVARASDRDAPEAVQVPVGHHVRVHRRVDGEEVVRSYTPVCPHWAGQESTSRDDDEVSPHLYLVVKRYHDGALSPALTIMAVGDTLTISGPYGNFQLERLRRTRRAYLLAAGTGITPMLSLITFLLARRNPKCDVVLLIYFNKREEDIILRDKLESLSAADERLLVTHVLSEPSDAWSGPRGRVSADLLQRLIPPLALRCGDACEHAAAACGPSAFTARVQTLVLERGMRLDCFHAFAG